MVSINCLGVVFLEGCFGFCCTQDLPYIFIVACSPPFLTCCGHYKGKCLFIVMNLFWREFFIFEMLSPVKENGVFLHVALIFGITLVGVIKMWGVFMRCLLVLEERTNGKLVMICS